MALSLISAAFVFKPNSSLNVSTNYVASGATTSILNQLLDTDPICICIHIIRQIEPISINATAKHLQKMMLPVKVSSTQWQ